MKLEMQNVIDELILGAKSMVEKHANKCKTDGTRLCNLELDFRSNPGYVRAEWQCFYMLKYYYAYLVQYYFLYQYIHLDDYKIFSVGCGNYIDLLGFLCQNKEDKPVKYLGVDPVKWHFCEAFEKYYHLENIVNFFSADFEAFLQDEQCRELLKNINVFVFPKSIEYIDFTQCSSWFDKIEFEESVIYILVNAMERGYEADEKKLDVFIDLFEKKGYCISRKPIHRESVGLRDYYISFSGSPNYPKDILYEWLPSFYKQCADFGRCGRNTCCLEGDCHPMIKTDSFKFMIYRLEK